jgi:DNA-binding MarR family transcriptional regulator
METGSSKRGRLGGLLGYNLRRASAAMMTDFSAEFSGVALRPVQFAILTMIADNEGTSQTELCRELNVQKANMVPLVAELERRGLLTRKPATRDRRVHLLTLTAQAEREMPAWRALVTAHEERFFGPLSATERAQLLNLLSKLWVAEESDGAADKGPTGAG